MARREGSGVRLLTRNGHDWGSRYPLIVEAVAALRVRACLIDGEAVCCDANSLAVFAKLRCRRNDQHVLLRAKRPATRTPRTPQGIADAIARHGESRTAS